MEKQYINLFKTTEEYNEFCISSAFTKPNVTLCEDTNKVYFSETSLPYIKKIKTNGQKYVDLGLPSGTLWAKHNVGSSDRIITPLYFAWGEISGYDMNSVNNGNKFFNWDNYKFLESNDGNEIKFTKYNSQDGKIILDLEDDAAHEYMGGSWHIPTKEQFEELLENTTSTWTTQNGFNGRLFTSLINGNSIFFPAFGYVDSEDGSGQVSGYNESVNMWTSSLYSGPTAFYLPVHSDEEYELTDDFRYYGCTIRGVVEI